MKYAILIFFILFICCCGPSTQTKDTINAALKYGTETSVSSMDTLHEKIYGDLAPNIEIIKVNNKYGLYDTLAGNAIAPAKYDEIGSFTYENAIKFAVNKKYGYLNSKGEEFIKAQYDFTTDFSNGLAAVKLNDKWGYVNKQGKAVVPIEYEMAWTFKGKMGAVKKNNKWGFINSKGKYILEPIYDDVTYDFTDTIPVANVSIGTHHFYIDRKGKRLYDSKPYEKFQK